MNLACAEAEVVEAGEGQPDSDLRGSDRASRVCRVQAIQTKAFEKLSCKV